MTDQSPPAGKLTFRQLEIFLAASRSESFSAAAKKLDVAQPSLSAAIAKVEHQLGVTLFDRTTRNVTLTAEGARLAVAAADLIKIYRSSIQNLASGAQPEARVRFAAPPALLGGTVAPIAIREFRRRFPDYQVTFHDVDRREAIKLLVGGSVDFAIVNDPPNLAEVEKRVIGETSFEVIIAADHPLAKRKSVTWQDLETAPLILAGNLRRRGLIQEAWESAGHDLRPTYEVNELRTGVGMAAAGLGFVLLPEGYLDPELPAHLAAVRLESDSFKRPLGLLRLKSQPLSDPTQHLAELLERQLQSRQKTRKPRTGKTR